MQHLRRSISILTVTAALVATPVYAIEDEPTPTPAEEQTTRITQRIALEKARADLANARLETLNLTSDTTGTTELENEGGEFEGWLLSAHAIEAAAEQIAGALRRAPSVNPATSGDGARTANNFVILAADEQLDLGLPNAMSRRLRALERRAAEAHAAAECGARPVSTTMSVAPFLPYLGALIGAFRTDTAISGFSGPTDARLVVNALAGRIQPGDNWYLPSIISVPASSALATSWYGLEGKRGELSACRQGVARQPESPRRAARLALLDGAIAEITEFETSNILGEGSDVSPFVRAIRLEGLAGMEDLRVVRVYVERAGGSILVRRNLWTMLGAPAVGVSGGAIVGWRVSDAASGRLRGGGNLSCRTQLSNMRAIQDGRVRASNCDRPAASAGSR